MIGVAFIASLAVVAAPCGTTAEILSDAKVSAWREATTATAADLGLVQDAPGLAVRRYLSVEWERCDVALRPYLVGGGAILPSGERIDPIGGRLQLWARAVTREPEPGHPRLGGMRFASSTGLSIGTLRAGVWHRGDGGSELWLFDPEAKKAPQRLLRSARTLVGVSYLPSPDAAGGSFTLWQQRAPGRYRVIGISWTEEGAR